MRTRVTMNDEHSIRYVLDTDTVSAYQRSHRAVLARVAAQGPDAVATTVVTMYEQLRGRMSSVHRATTGESLLRAYRWLHDSHRYFCGVIVLPFDTAAAGIYRSLVAQRLRIGTQDLRVAAIVLANDAILVTRNRRDFERAPGLRIEDWTAG